ncbi:MAG: lysophospholipase [Oscillospiraceae bacterium]|nr:lysophospholipase [Oscillospiraceae bacterium]
MKTKKKIRKIVGIVLAALAVIFCIASVILVQVLFDQTFARTAPREQGLTAYLRYWDVEEQYSREEVSFLSGKNRLYGHLYGAGNPGGLVVISHGMGGGEESYLAEALYFVDQGYQVLCYSNTGCWDSEGKTSIGLNQSVLDLDAALTWVEGESRFDGVPVFLYGHSWGGYAVAAVFHFGHDIAASASVAGFNEAMPMIIEWGRDMLGPLIYAEYPFIWLNQRMTFGDTFGLTAVDAINSTDTPVLILHGDGDETVGYDTVSIISQKDRITNPNVQCAVCAKPPQNDHNRLFQSLESITYHDELNEAYNKLYEQYDGEIPEDVERAFYAEADPFLLSELDAEFMERVAAFYREAKQ